jgi:hypothetical protein
MRRIVLNRTSREPEHRFGVPVSTPRFNQLKGHIWGSLNPFSVSHYCLSMPFASTNSVRSRAFLAVTIALGLAYALAALAFAQPGEAADFGWPGRFNIWSGLLLVLLALYGGVWLLGRRAVGSPRPRRAGWRGAAYGVLALLALVVLVGAWNAVRDVLSTSAHGPTAAEFFRRLGDECFNYIVKPLVYIMPLGSLVAGPLGWWVGRGQANVPT